MKSWQTTLAGVAAIIAAIATAVASQFDDDPATIAEWGVVIGLLAAGIGNVVGRDHNKSSEDVGIK